MASDRLTGPLRAIARRADPLQPYRCLYRARLVAQSGDLQRVDVIPEDTGGLLPPMSNIPLRHGVPGVSVRVSPGAYLLVGWESARPTRPFAALWANPHATGEADARADSGTGGGVVAAIIMNGLSISLGGGELVPLVDGVVTGQAIDTLTGLPLWQLGNSSAVVAAKKS